MGSGTSHGVPVIGCDCPVCKSKDPHDKRYRASAFVTDGKSNIVIDTGPEFRVQALRQGIKTLDAVLMTHGHADHLHGLDDVRIFSSTKQNGVWHRQTSFFDSLLNRHGDGLKVFANSRTKKIIFNHFDYIFMHTQKGGGKPRIDLWDVNEFSEKHPLTIGEMSIIPVPMLHGKLNSTGYLFTDVNNSHSIAYLTDLNYISNESVSLINRAKGSLDHLVIDALRIRKHSTHFNFDEALALSERLKPRHTWFTHLTHDLSHVQVQKYIDENLSKYKNLELIVKEGGSVSPAYDTLELSVESGN